MEALRIRIPQRYQSGIAKLVSLPGNSIEEFLSALDEMPSTFNLDKLKSQITVKIRSISIEDVSEIIDTLDALHFLHFEGELSLEDFVEQICQAMDRSGNEKLQLNPDARAQFKKRLFRILDGRLLAISAKARYVLLEHDRIFGRMRITTDIRSVFGPNIGDQPIAAVIVHMLKVHYIQGQEHKDLFLALDTADIAVLIEMLKQAQAKAEALKSTLTLRNISYIDAE